MKSIFSTVLLLVAAAASAAVPRVSQVRLAQDGRHRARVTYELAEAPGIVTFDILTNGVSIGASALTNAVGDVNRLVQPGSRTIEWAPWETWPGRKFTTACVAAKVTVWPTNAPPDYLAVDLTKPDYPVTYYAAEAALPWGKIWQNQKYKGDVLLMRRIHASHVLSLMGSPVTEANHLAGRETRRFCTLTNDYYLGVYPVTFRHYYLLNDSSATEARLTPVNSIAYNQLRYNNANINNTALPINFPTTTGRTTIGGTSILKPWRDRTGLTFDLPTSAQWEYACRAGSTTPIYLHPSCDGTMAQLGMIAGGYGEVGLHGGNYWNLFDMLGNVYEWCLDYFDTAIPDDPVVDPFGPTSLASLQRVIRGFHTQQMHWRSAFFSGSHHVDGKFGFRLCVTLP